MAYEDHIDSLQTEKWASWDVKHEKTQTIGAGGIPGRKFLYLHEMIFDSNLGGEREAKNKPYWLASRDPNPAFDITTKKPDAVIICATVSNEYGKFLVVTAELRIALGGYEISFPAGCLEEGETPEELAIREFKEETGLDLTVSSISPNLYSSAGMTDEAVPVVFGHADGIISDEYLHNDEQITTVLAQPNFVKRIVRGEFKDVAYGAKAWCLMHGILNDDGTDFRSF